MDVDKSAPETVYCHLHTAQITRADLKLIDGKLGLEIEVKKQFWDQSYAKQVMRAIPDEPEMLLGYVKGLLQFFNVSSLSALTGRFVRTIGTSKELWFIGDFLHDRWIQEANDQTRFYVYDSLPTKRWTEQKLAMDQAGTFTARIKWATIVPHKSGLGIKIRLEGLPAQMPAGSANSENTRHCPDIQKQYDGTVPDTIVIPAMDTTKLAQAVQQLCLVGGVGQWEKLPGRFLRLDFNGLQHPVMKNYFEFEEFNARLERSESEGSN